MQHDRRASLSFYKDFMLACLRLRYDPSKLQLNHPSNMMMYGIHWSEEDAKKAIKALWKKEIRATILLAVVAFHAPLLMFLSSRQRRSGRPVLRFMLWAVSAAYFPLMTFVMSYLTTYIPSAHSDDDDDDTAFLRTSFLLLLVVLTQFLRAKADMAALAVAAVASPAAAGGDDLKIRPSTESFINTFWVAGLVIYNVCRQKDTDLLVVMLLISPLWVLGACRTVLRFAAFRKATASFALGRNAQLIAGYMVQLRQGGCFDDDTGDVPPLIVTGERNRDVEETPAGYHVKRLALQQDNTNKDSKQQSSSKLVTLDRVWSWSESESDDDGRRRLMKHNCRDLCLSFALFKCLRRRFAGYRLAEAGTSWAFRFIHDGLLGPHDDHKRIFRVIAGELSFASDFFHSPLPVASLGTKAAALHFLLSLLILSFLTFLVLFLIALFCILIADAVDHSFPPLLLLAIVLALVNASTEISEMVDGVRSNWTKISIIGHNLRSRHRCVRAIFACLLRCKHREFWKHEMRQTELLLEPCLLPGCRRPCACACRLLFKFKHLLSLFFLRWNKNQHNKAIIKIPPVVEAAILRSFRDSGGKLSAGAAAVRRRQQHGQLFGRLHDITWACRDGGGDVATTTDAILIWHIATSLFDIIIERDDDESSSSSASTSTCSVSVVVARTLSRYCTYLVAEAPDLLPDDSAWTKRRYEDVRKGIEEASSKCFGGDVVVLEKKAVYGHQLIEAFSGMSYHEVLNKGTRLAKQLVEEAEIIIPSSGSVEAAAGDQADKVWELLAEFWSEMVLYLAPSDDVKGHIEGLQRGGELLTLLWALLLHAGITSRPEEFNPVTCVPVSSGELESIIDPHIIC